MSMQNGKIKSYSDLLEEEQRVLMQYKRDRAKVVDKLNRLKNILKPAEQFMTKISSWFSRPPSHQIFPKMMDIGLDILSKKLLFKNAGWIKSFIGSYAVRTVSQYFMDKVSQHKQQRNTRQDGTEETLNQ